MTGVDVYLRLNKDRRYVLKHDDWIMVQFNFLPTIPDLFDNSCHFAPFPLFCPCVLSSCTEWPPQVWWNWAYCSTIPNSISNILQDEGSPITYYNNYGPQNGKIVGPKPFASPPLDRVELFAPPRTFFLKCGNFLRPTSEWLKLKALVLELPQNVAALYITIKQVT